MIALRKKVVFTLLVVVLNNSKILADANIDNNIQKYRFLYEQEKYEKIVMKLRPLILMIYSLDWNLFVG